MSASLWDSIARAWGGLSRLGASSQVPMLLPPSQDPLAARYSVIAQYRTLWAMYENNGLYDLLSSEVQRQGLWKESLKPLRNPSNRIVEFHVSKLWPGSDLEEALPIDGVADPVKKAIMQTWKWSNLTAQKQIWARWFGAYGDLFVKVIGETTPVPKVYFQRLLPEYCTHVLHDERGFLRHIRIDVPQVREDRIDMRSMYWYTEIWDKDDDSLTIYEHERGPLASPEDMGAPKEDLSIMGAYGIDFIPIVQAQFRDMGEDRGWSAFAHAYDKITEANRMATRLHQMAFRHSNVTMAFTAGGMDANMLPSPPPQIEFEGAQPNDPRRNDMADGTMLMGDDRVLKLPGNADVKFLVPNLPYAQLLDVLKDHMAEIEDDCPEMAYYRLREMGSQLSGRAVRLLLDDAISRGIEARGNGEQAIIRLDAIALTIGQLIGAFPGLTGSFDAGTFDHTFKERPFIKASDLEDAQAEAASAQAKVTKSQLGVPDIQLQRELGYTEEEIAQMAADKTKQDEEALTRQMKQFAATGGGPAAPPQNGGQPGGGGGGANARPAAAAREGQPVGPPVARNAGGNR